MTQPDLVSKLRDALERIARGQLNTPFAVCNCTHDDENCCEKVGEWCPQCIAATALAIAPPEQATPIVPGTAGLSAEQLREVFCGHIPTLGMSHDWPFWREKADRLNALLGAAKPAPVECPDAREGHRKPCYYCGKPCNDLAGNPSQWSLAFPHRDEPGKVKWQHVGCVLERLVENERDARIRKDALEEAAKVARDWATELLEGDLGSLARQLTFGTCEGIAKRIEDRALAERPAPAGEARLPRCQAHHPEGGQCEFLLGHDCKHLAGSILWAGEVKGEK